LKEKGITTHIASMKTGPITGKHGYEINIDVALKDVNPTYYNIFVVSGGKGPEKMRLDKDVLEITDISSRKTNQLLQSVLISRF
jgi:protease I